MSMNKMGEFGQNVFFNDREIELLHSPHLDTPINVHWDYQAIGRDKSGKEYLVTWELLDCYKNGDAELDDDSNACNWDIYTIEELN